MLTREGKSLKSRGKTKKQTVKLIKECLTNAQVNKPPINFDKVTYDIFITYVLEKRKTDKEKANRRTVFFF